MNRRGGTVHESPAEGSRVKQSRNEDSSAAVTASFVAISFTTAKATDPPFEAIMPFIFGQTPLSGVRLIRVRT